MGEAKIRKAPYLDAVHDWIPQVYEFLLHLGSHKSRDPANEDILAYDSVGLLPWSHFLEHQTIDTRADMLWLGTKVIRAWSSTHHNYGNLKYGTKAIYIC